jgi:hypothetical protein
LDTSFHNHSEVSASWIAIVPNIRYVARDDLIGIIDEIVVVNTVVAGYGQIVQIDAVKIAAYKIVCDWILLSLLT